MFRQLILDALSEGSKGTQELYQLARQRQPRDCPDTPCPHRERVSNGDKEWMHELRRNQFQLKREGRMTLRNGMWYIV
ncbi:MAG: hypothetical protein ABSE93_17900 [Terriglobia bacterium]|jgi:hypothetical protein